MKNINFELKIRGALCLVFKLNTTISTFQKLDKN